VFAQTSIKPMALNKQKTREQKGVWDLMAQPRVERGRLVRGIFCSMIPDKEQMRAARYQASYPITLTPAHEE
jgi:hypothetical protein